MAGLYIHIPFCKQKCHYCDFHFAISQKNKPAVLEGLNKELELKKVFVKAPLETIYFGGGTPSVLSAAEIERLITSIRTHYSIVKQPEITLEANPDDLSEDFLKRLFKFGFNRLSIGVQSFFDEDLKFLNRAHSGQEAIKAIKTAQQIGFKNITIDLIYGVPGLTKEKWMQNIETFLSLKIPHLSSYALTVEPQTALDHFIKTKQYPPLDEELALEHFNILRTSLKTHNYMHYELSNFAKKGYISRHNTSYWQSKSYIGIGPSAHSYYLNTRTWNVANNSRYYKALQQGIIPEETEQLSDKERYNEYIMTGLRTMWGVDLEYIKDNFGQEYKTYLIKNATLYIENKQLEVISNRLIVSDKSFFLIDGIIADLFYV